MRRLALAALLLVATHVSAVGQQPGGAYTVAQACRGQAVFAHECASCHDENRFGAPRLAGRPFLMLWGERTAASLLGAISTTMPMGAEGSLSKEVYADVVAYLLHAVGVPAGERELAGGPELDAVVLPSAWSGNPPDDPPSACKASPSSSR